MLSQGQTQVRTMHNTGRAEASPQAPSTPMSSEAGSRTHLLSDVLATPSSSPDVQATLPPIGSRANNTQPPSRSEADTPPTAVYDETGVRQLMHMFPTTSESVIRYIYDLNRGDLACASFCILSGPCFGTLISSVVLTGDGEGRKLKIEDNEQEGDDLAERVLAFYKGPRYDPHCGI